MGGPTKKSGTTPKDVGGDDGERTVDEIANDSPSFSGGMQIINHLEDLGGAFTSKYRKNMDNTFSKMEQKQMAEKKRQQLHHHGLRGDDINSDELPHELSPKGKAAGWVAPLQTLVMDKINIVQQISNGVDSISLAVRLPSQVRGYSPDSTRKQKRT